MEKLSLTTSTSDWHKKLSRFLKNRVPIVVLNDSLIPQSQFENDFKEIIEKYTLPAWQQVIRKALLVFLPLLAIVFSYFFILLILDPGANQISIILITKVSISFIVIIALSLFSIYKLLSARKPITNFNDNEITITWEKY